MQVAKAHVRVSDWRRDWAHRHSTAIIRANQAVYVEDLCVKGLTRSRMAKSVHDAGWGMFTRRRKPAGMGGPSPGWIVGTRPLDCARRVGCEVRRSPCMSRNGCAPAA
ncbi:hypothetical protein AB0M34_02665 [Nocardia sp. NPDC050193]